VIIDLERFIRDERPTWDELERVLQRLDREPERRMSTAELQRFHYLHERTAADLAKLSTFSFEPETLRYLDMLVGKSYAEIHETRERRHRFAPRQWFFKTFPRTFRRHIAAFRVAVAVTMVGSLFGSGALLLDPEAKETLMPFPNLQQSPSERVAEEERKTDDNMSGAKMTFSSQLMTHNTRISILSMGLGMTYGVGTLVLLFYNGVLLGAVAADYIASGELTFLLGWLLPHGSVEIPAFLIAGQAGLLLGGALIGRGRRVPLRQRLRAIGGDVVTLIGGVAVLLVWAGFVESFLSQYHEPVLPYSWKIAFGSVELALLILFLAKSGLEKKPAAEGGVDGAA
jgi:uncharacterized membrane protein SpoIIM required for sporulation